ncbi:CD276 antigen-like [Hemitrygon akajei]|uniref:CD276 antigen-like n=1 Tax=Hemitrygon akajei TaxID=2704970 RepID=UPI003BF9858A
MLFLLLSAIVLSVSVVSADNNRWTKETPDVVVGRQGNSLVLFCFFTLPHDKYNKNISIVWKYKKGNEALLNYTNYLSGQEFKNHIEYNKGDRFQPLGNPRENDASIFIKELKKEEDGKAFNCQEYLTEEPLENDVDADRTSKVKVENASEPSVIVKRGDSATLPCYFTFPFKKPSSISIVWMKGNLPDVSIVFNQTRSSSASPPYTNTVNEGGRYELVGDPERGNASIRVTDLRMNDTSRYFCHIWFEIKRNKTTVIQNEMTLQIDVPATILSLSLVTDDTGATLECRAEGKPPANITWIDLENSTLPMNSSEMRVTGDLESVGKLVLSGLRGSYRCVAMNKHGSDTREIHLAKTGTSALMLARYIVFSTLAIVPLVVFAVWSLKKGSCQRGCCVDSPAASGVKSQTEPAPQRRNLVA